MKHDHISFIYYNMDQLILPLDLEILIPEHHLARVVHEAVEQLDDSIFLPHYKGGGRSSYHPKMMLKILVYAYAEKIYSGRKIAKQLKENIYFMWLSGNQQPDFRTINRFRSERMKPIIYEVFFSVVELLRQKGLVRLEDYYLDGTKIEANANRYSFVWIKAVKKYDEKLNEKYRKIAFDIERVLEGELQQESLDLDEQLEQKPVTSKEIQETMKKVDEHLKKDPSNKTLKKAKKQLSEDLLPRKQKYEQQRKIAQERNSFSKTDHDATFMRMKEDHMKNGQLKPGYNVQMGTEGQFIIGYSLHQRAGDTRCFIEHLEHVKQYISLPQNIIADSGYGSEENYTYLEEQGKKAYIPYNTFDQEQKRTWKKRIERVENMEYDEEFDEFICANGQRFTFQYETKKESDHGYLSIKRRYRCDQCQGCPFQSTCAKRKTYRTITISLKNQIQRKEVKERLLSDDGKEKYRCRKIDVESVYGQIKQNLDFRRFHLRGLSKTTVEWGLVCVAHNFKKWQKIRALQQGEIR
ncbi:IS1182 family transposase [Bacillus smithii]|uniref:IS1182 family transposase n=1 Tax=Bacillus smithii TaxID=1479 RepID=UPI002E22B951|nr:IS1182 family transposase [Bacillus smithii]MED1457856.1 IS1182 family transposase [Bacillus smithii]MED1489928.1 IS1182 family transposase [Bacillus smithii]